MGVHCVFGLKILLSLIVSAELTLHYSLSFSPVPVHLDKLSDSGLKTCCLGIHTLGELRFTVADEWRCAVLSLPRTALDSWIKSAAKPKPTGSFWEIPVQLLLASAMETRSLEETEFNNFASSSSGDLRACSRPVSFGVYCTCLASSSCPENFI